MGVGLMLDRCSTPKVPTGHTSAWGILGSSVWSCAYTFSGRCSSYKI